MSRPPRIPNLLPGDLEVIYFLTFCVQGRLKVLDNQQAWDACCAVFRRFDQWHFFSAMAMPDHLHILAAPKNRGVSISSFSKFFKRWFKEEFDHPWSWQEGCSDRLLRTNESWEEKWLYVRQNPVRADLVLKPEDWPHRLDPPGIGFLL